VETENERIEYPLEEIRPLVPNSCLYCPDMTAEWSDVSAGVLEGRPDWNTLIVRTPKGRELVKRAVDEGYLITEEMPEENLEHLVWAAGNKKKRAISRAEEEGLMNCLEDGKHSLFRLAAETVVKITS
jgi:coenzyme F420-reducing hydrogenase beta subunit